MSEEGGPWYTELGSCHFCVISSTAESDPNPTIAASPTASAYLILSTHSVVGFLEAAPMSRGHIVLLPREHASKISDLSEEASSVMGFWLPIVSRGVMSGLFGPKWQDNDESWNIFQANGKMAGQTIKHVHFHMIPRPRPEMKSAYGETRDPSEIFTYEKRREKLGVALRSNMQDEEGIEACQLIRAALKKEILRMKLKGKIVEGSREMGFGWKGDERDIGEELYGDIPLDSCLVGYRQGYLLHPSRRPQVSISITASVFKPSALRRQLAPALACCPIYDSAPPAYILILDPATASMADSKPPPKDSYTTMDTSDPTLIGSHCQDPYCNQLDFLPFRCESCFGTFCLDHRSETAHKCPKAGDWARRRAAATAASSTTSGRTTLAVDTPRPCASPTCKTVTSAAGRNPGVHCSGCNRTYCLKHRLKEDHDCKNLVPIGARPARFDTTATTDKARLAFGRLKAWGSARKEEAEKATTRVLPKPKPSSNAARVVAVNALKKTAKGDEKIAPEKRVYIYVEAEAATTKAKFPKGEFFYSRDWVVGRVLDAAAKSLQVQNVNNQSEDEREKLRVFHVEGGRLLEFGEKVGSALVSGNTIVLLRGVGPAIPNLIEA
ncbi:hypothetical protein V492_03434 [Pseudogymnoascus sp. VKM F-4246]|nr:hypothetical protein V492_03434 [Pseudogymnoascus sp. VKM F-4246]